MYNIYGVCCFDTDFKFIIVIVCFRTPFTATVVAWTIPSKSMTSTQTQVCMELCYHVVLFVALSGKMAQNAFFGENELLSFSCSLLSLEHTNSNFVQNGQFLTENQLFL